MSVIFVKMRLVRALVAALAWAGCHNHDDGGHDHAHGEGGEHAAEEPEPEPISVTRWTERYELFVEIPPPVVGTPVSYHAHVTRLSDFYAVRKGRFTSRFKDASGNVVVEHAVTGAKRPGIFVFEGEAPPLGSYAVDMSYEADGQKDTWDCGTIEVLAEAPPPADAEPDTTLAFLKESQWKIAFATAWADARPVRQAIEMTGVVEPAASDQLAIVAMTGGRFLHDPKRALAVGLRVAPGDVLGTIVPNVAGEDYSRLVFAAEDAAISKQQNDREIARVAPLVEQGLLPKRRLLELENERELLESRLRLAQARLYTVSGEGRKGLEVKAEIAGTVAELLAGNGRTVESGDALVRLGASNRLWARARLFGRGPFVGATPSEVRVPASTPIDLKARGAAFLSEAPIFDPATRVGTWIVDLGTGGGELPAEVRPGASVIVTAHVGDARSMVTVPAGAVVEIDTKPFVFVQVDGEHFAKRPIVVGTRQGDRIAIENGVEAGERVVTVGGFDIHLAAVMGTVESHRH